MSKFWIGFIIALPVGAIVGYFVAALCAVSGRASRMEEKIEDSIKLETATQGKPEDD